jgi:hypothetical protein
MNRWTRLTLLRASAAGAAISTFAILTRPSSAAEFVFRYANNNVADHPMNIRLRVQPVGPDCGNEQGSPAYGYKET